MEEHVRTLSFPVNPISSKDELSSDHLQYAKQIKYLYDTRLIGIEYNKADEMVLQAYVDSEYANGR
jgi:hypothetical protein